MTVWSKKRAVNLISFHQSEFSKLKHLGWSDQAHRSQDSKRKARL